MWRSLRERVGWRVDRLGRRLAERGVPPAWLAYRWVRKTTLPELMSDGPEVPGSHATATIHPRRTFTNPLPTNFQSREQLPDDRGWWGYSMHDVPERTSAATVIATLPGATVLPFRDASVDYFRPAILTRTGASLEMREISFRDNHARLLRRRPATASVERATWIAERVYDNHSHWLTAHLPKLVLLRDRGMLDHVLLPERRTPVMDASIRRVGLEPTSFRTFTVDRPLRVDRLTVVSTDRFRPELVRSVRQAMVGDASEPTERIYVSRARAARRRLLNEDAIWPMLEERGFDRVFFEDLDFDAQVDLAARTKVMVAPHGAGLTNMMFCPPGTHVIEIADLGFPNPNFYALASALGHVYWLIPAEGLGDVHPLEKDMVVEPDAVARVLDRVLA